MGALSNLYDPDEVLWTGCPCGLHATMFEHQAALADASKGSRFYCAETTEGPERQNAQRAEGVAPSDRAMSDLDGPAGEELDWKDQEKVLANVAHSAILKGIFGADANRRAFLRAVGSGTAMAAISSILPIDKAIANIVDAKGPLEKTALNVGFVPITCATPIIMAKPLGFYERYGLDVDVIKTAGWAVSRDKSLSYEYDAAHMLTPMPLAITVGSGSAATPWTMPAVENINGQAITLAMKHKDKQDPKL